MMPKALTSPLWKYFTKCGNNFRAICLACHEPFSYRSSTGNLKAHLKKRHHSVYCLLIADTNNQNRTRDVDEDSNSSIKFFSEIWGNFEQEDNLARCTVCQKTTENTVEEMRNHLGEEHPAILIRILSKKPTEEKNDDSDEDRTQEDPIEEDTFTEVVYLDEEPKHKRRHVFKRPKPNGNTSVQQAKPRIEYQVIPHEAKEEARPEIDSFLNYVGVLLKNVPKDSFPKLQLDVISLILNAQMAQPVTVPSTAVITVPTQVLSAINSTDYHITIGNKDDKNM